MPRGTLLVWGADIDWFTTFAGRLSGMSLRVLQAQQASPDPAIGPGVDADFHLIRTRETSPDIDGRDNGNEESWWRLEPGRGQDAALSLPPEGLLLAESRLSPSEVGDRLRACMDREMLLARQREFVESLTQARQTLENECDSLRSELGRSNRRLERTNLVLEQRVEELCTLNAELARLKEMNANIVAALKDGLIACDEKGIISHWNQDATELLGWEPSEVLGKPLTQFFTAPEADGALLLDLVSRSKGSGPLHISLNTKSMKTRPVELRVSSLGVETSISRGRLLLLRDLAKKQRIEEQARRRDRLASLGELSAGVAHEIRNPLAGIATTAELLRSRLPASAPEVQFVQVILEEVGRLDQIITDLLTFARPSKPRPVSRDIHRILDRMVLLLRRQISHSGIHVVRKYDRSIPRVQLDPDQTLQLFLNVGLNAIEAMGEGGTLTVTTRLASKTENTSAEDEIPYWAHVIIQDTGPGVPAEYRDKVFNPFFTTKPKGSGLGLAICQRIVEEQGGTIYLESSSTQPTTVLIEFPIDAGPLSTDEQTDLFTDLTSTDPIGIPVGGRP